MALDCYLFVVLNQYAGQNFFVDKTFIFFAEYLVAFFVVLFLIEFRKAKAVYNAIFSSVSVVVLNILISMVYYRPRPFVSHNAHLIINHVKDASFPSDHAAISFAFATALFIYNRKVGVVAYGIAILISISRVFAGLHYMTDIIAGAILGIAVSLVINIFLKKVDFL